jgi:hypothetical protein
LCLRVLTGISILTPKLSSIVHLDTALGTDFLANHPPGAAPCGAKRQSKSA